MKIESMKEKLQEVLDTINFKYYMASPGTDCVVEIFRYPYALFSTDAILNKSGNMSESVLEKVSMYSNLMLDSGIFNPEITNKEILEVAEKIKPSVVVPKDYFFDNPRTIESVKEFASLCGSYKLKGTKVLIPLQKPWVIDHAFRNHDYFALGGIIKLSGPSKRKVIEKMVNKYSDKNFHLFGVGLKAFMDLIFKYKNIVSSDTNMERKSSIDRCNIFHTTGKYFTICAEFYVLVSFFDELLAYYNYVIDDSQRTRTQVTLF